MKKEEICPHCYPEESHHWRDKLDSFCDLICRTPFAKLRAICFPAKYTIFLRKYCKIILMKVIEELGFIERSSEIDRSQFRNSILVWWDEAQRRGLQIYNFKLNGRHTFNFLLVYRGKKYYFDYNPIQLEIKPYPPQSQAMYYDDKAALKKILVAHQFPCAKGQVFISRKKALDYGRALGFPLAVKPKFSSLSRHVSMNVCDQSALKKAIEIAKMIHCEVIVEKHIEGAVHRALVLGNSLIACARREAPAVVGNGVTSVEKLIEEKNRHPLRAERERRDASLHQIEITLALIKCLKEQNVSLQTKLKKGQKIILANKVTTHIGADIVNVTERLHMENKKLLEKIHGVLNIPLSGLDFICSDVTIPWQQQAFAVIENNSLPFIDMHHYPSLGEPINVAAYIWDEVIARL